MTRKRLRQGGLRPPGVGVGAEVLLLPVLEVHLVILDLRLGQRERLRLKRLSRASEGCMSCAALDLGQRMDWPGSGHELVMSCAGDTQCAPQGGLGFSKP